VREQTRHEAILDLIFTNSKNLIENVAIIESFSNSDHNMIQFNINLKSKNAYCKKAVLYRDFSLKNFNKLNSIFFSTAWEDFFNQIFNIDELYLFFSNFVKNSVDIIMPLKTKKSIIKSKYSPEIKDFYKKKIELHKRMVVDRKKYAIE